MSNVRGIREYSRSTLRLCGVCNRELDLVSVPRPGSCIVEEFCRKCQSPFYHLDFFRRKVKDKAGNVTSIVADPKGFDTFRRLHRALFGPIPASRKALPKLRAEWEEFISTRPSQAWYVPPKRIEEENPADEKVGRTSLPSLSRPAVMVPIRRERDSKDGFRPAGTVERYATVPLSPFEPVTTGADLSLLREKDKEEKPTPVRKVPRGRKAKVESKTTLPDGRTIIRLEGAKTPPAGSLSMPKSPQRTRFMVGGEDF